MVTIRNVYVQKLGRNSEFCVAVGPVSRTAGTLAYCMLAGYIDRDRPRNLCVNLLRRRLLCTLP